MKLVGDFLSRFQGLTPPHDSLRRAVAETLRETVGISVGSEKISIKNGVAFVAVSSVAKNTIQLNRGKILSALFEHMPRARELLRDIR